MALDRDRGNGQGSASLHQTLLSLGEIAIKSTSLPEERRGIENESPILLSPVSRLCSPDLESESSCREVVVDPSPLSVDEMATAESGQADADG